MITLLSVVALLALDQVQYHGYYTGLVALMLVAAIR